MMCFGVKDRKRSKTNHCVIVLLDDTQLVHELHSSSTGQDLLDVVIKHLNLLETSYFGLKYLDSSLRHNEPNKMMEQIWLDVNKSAIKQLRDVHPMTVYFGVKYYASDPCKLAEEITRYQFFLQCKQDILHSKLPISFDLAVELFALAVQSELGDYDPQRHRDGYVSEFQFLASQSMELEKRVALFHRNLTGQVPATAELNFLERVKWLDLYGCELHPIQYEENCAEEYAIGLNPSGVLVLRNKQKVAHYDWARIVKTKCQGRCFLMDVINKTSATERNRFGFRLSDKGASRRLRWAIEEHKSFHHLVHNSASLSQIVQRQQQHQQNQNHLKLSQRFRNSIRSAIGPLSSLSLMQQQMAAQQQRDQEQQLKLRSSMKSLHNQQQALIQQQQYAIDSRQPPTVVRMPSRRYSNRSLTRLAGFNGTSSAANGNGLPNVAAGVSQTMVESQRQQAMLMMNQFNQMNSMMGKSQTLKPMPNANKLDSKEAKKNPYYQMMMMMMANSQQHPDVAILPAGQHIVQPNIYKASSVLNGVNQLAGKQEVAQQRSAMMQFFNTRPQYYQPSSGHESPRSTKSAIATSSSLKAASRKLARQQQQLLFGNGKQAADAQPLLAFDPNQQQQVYGASTAEYYGVSGAAPTYNNCNSTSANPSPRSVRSARMAGGRHKSKSTNENLHLLHNGKYMQQQPALDSNKMLLATAQLVQQQNMAPPPPGYHSNSQLRSKGRNLCSDNESDVSKMSKRSGLIGSGGAKKRATFALNNEQANLLMNTNGLVSGKQVSLARNQAHLSDCEDDYCCSRSDCSSADEGSRKLNNHLRSARGSLINGQQQQQQRRKRSSNSMSQQMDPQRAHLRATSNVNSEQQEWNAIRKRHNEFNNGKGFLMHNGSAGNKQDSALDQLSADGGEARARRQTYNQEDLNNNTSNANNNSSQLVKSISNKQATPILLSLNYDQSNANNKAVQLLNLQRQQLNSQSSDAGTKSSSSVVDSAASSVPSSPQANGSQQQQQQSTKANKTTDSTASSSTTTSGYYAGSNSTGSASVDSDSQATTDGNQLSNKQQLACNTKVESTRHHSKNQNYPAFNDWREESSRAKIALGSYTSRMSGGRLLIGGHQNHPKGTNSDSLHRQQQQQQQQQRTSQKQQQFYLGEANNNEDDCNSNQNLQAAQLNIGQQQWSPLNQIQQHAPSSLKYVSFDV